MHDVPKEVYTSKRGFFSGNGKFWLSAFIYSAFVRVINGTRATGWPPLHCTVVSLFVLVNSCYEKCDYYSYIPHFEDILNT